MKKNNLKKAFALGLSTALVSMSCLNASAIDYKKILNKKNINITTLGSAAILVSYFLYNHFKEKAYVFDTSCINELGKKKNQNTEPMLIDEVKAISEDEKSNIVKGRNENIKSILASREVKEKGNSLLIFSDGREVEGKELNLDENFRQDKDSKMLYFKLDGKLYELGEYMVEKAKDPNSEDTYFFACVDKKVWDDNALFNMNFGYTNDEISKIYKGDSWRTLLFVGYIYEA